MTILEQSFPGSSDQEQGAYAKIKTLPRARQGTEQQGAYAQKKKLPRDPEALRLRVGCIGAMSDKEVQQFTKFLDEVGAVVLKPDREEDELETYQTLDRLLGKHVWHDMENDHGIVELNPEKPTSINVADTHHPHQPHTDDAYTEQPAVFMTLNCRVAAKNGGESVLVSGADFLDDLSAEDLETLKKPGMVTMGRRPAEPNAPWKFTSSIPMFWVDQESKRLCLRWRCKDKCVKEVAPEALELYERLNNIALDDSKQLVVPLQPTEVLVLDNRAHAHGRTPYPKGEPRVLWRKNYFGNGQLAQSIKTGMVDHEAVQKPAVPMVQEALLGACSLVQYRLPVLRRNSSEHFT